MARVAALRSGARLWPLAYAFLASVVAFIASAGNMFRLNGVFAWVTAIVCWIYAWWPRNQQLIERPRTRAAVPRARILIPLAAIILVGTFFRYYRLHETPYDPTSDHAEKLLDVQDILDGRRPIFFPRNTGREPAQFYVIASMVRFMGLPPNFDTMKLGTAAVDVLAISAIYLVVAELGGPVAGLSAALAYSISAWPVGIARAGLRFPYAPLPTALALWLLFRYLRRGDRRDALLLGLTLGAGLYGYSPFRVVPLVVPMAFGVAWLRDPAWRARGARLVGDGLLIAITTLIVFIPLGHYMLEAPGMFWYRAASRTVGDQGRAPEGLAAGFEGARVFLVNNWNAALAFNVRGDSTFVNAYQYAPFLDTITGLMFLVGLALAVRAGFLRNEARWLIVLLSFPILFLSSTLALGFPIENPSVNRAGPVLPVAFALVGLGAGSLTQAAFRRDELTTRALVTVIVVGGVLIAAAENYERYFVRFDAQYWNFVLDSSEVADAIRPQLDQSLPLDRVYVVTWPYWFDTRLVAISLGNIRWAERHSIASADSLPPPRGNDTLVVLNREDQRDLQAVISRWPDAVVHVVPSAHPGRDFILVRIPASASLRSAAPET